MDLFIVENNIVKPNPETLLIQPFNLIWDQDESERKDWAMQQFMFIEFMMSMKKSNPFNGYTDNDERLHYVLLHHRRLTKDSSTGEPNNPFDIPLVISAMEVYKEFQDKAVPSAKYYNSAVAAADKLSQFFLDFDMNDTNERTGNPLYKPADITRALKETSEILKTLGSLREKVEQEIFESGKGKAGREINVFER